MSACVQLQCSEFTVIVKLRKCSVSSASVRSEASFSVQILTNTQSLSYDLNLGLTTSWSVAKLIKYNENIGCQKSEIVAQQKSKEHSQTIIV